MRNKALILAFWLSPLAAFAGDDKELDEALDRFKKGMANPSGPARAAAVAELARTPHEKTAARLGNLLGADVVAVRRAAALGLGSFKDYKKQAVPMLMSGIGPNIKEPEVVEAIFQGLGALNDDSALPTIHRYFEDKEAKIASAALLAAGTIAGTHKIPGTVDLIMDLLKKYDKINSQAAGGGGAPGTNIPGGGDDPKQKLAKDVLPNAIKAMQVIAKEKYTTFKEWQIWWNKYKAAFKPA